MAISPSARLGITRWSAGGDTFTRLQLDGDHSTLDSKTAIYLQSTAGTRPAAGIEGRYHFATDTKVVTYDDGVSWRTVTGGASNDGTKLLSLGGNLTVSGAYATTLTVTGNTSVTLPVSGVVVAATAPVTDNAIARFDGTGGAVQNSGITIDDSDKVTLGAVEFGSGGPRMMAGTGGPSGISAPVGSTWRQTNANASHGSLSGLLWTKVGTGTTEGTDWLVDYEGRWIAYTPTITQSVTVAWSAQASHAKYSRLGKMVQVICALAVTGTGTAGHTITLTLPVAAAGTGGGSFRHSDAANQNYSGWAGLYGAAALCFYAPGSVAAHGINAGTLSDGDYINVAITYEIA